MRVLLVAEQSVLPILPSVLVELAKWQIAEQVTIVVPQTQMAYFAKLQSPAVEVIAEQEILHRFSLEYVADRLGEYRGRAGWYLQQFVKLEFARIVQEPCYLIWDADTVPLAPVKLFCDGRWQLNVAKEFHQPYFDSFKLLFGTEPPLPFSLISQYLPVSSVRTREMLEYIERRHGMHWIDSTLTVLPRNGQSEFSEYETYGNFMAWRYPEEIAFAKNRWFRHGADILKIDHLPAASEIEHVFKRYAYVAFERRRHTVTKRILANILLKLGVSS